MSDTEIKSFVAFCRKLQPQSPENIKRFFEGVVLFPYDKELLLQAYLYLNIKNIFPLCTELLLFEKALNGENTDLGKCDFVYLTKENNLLLIETKFIDIQVKGRTKKTRRTQHRTKVIEQVVDLKTKFSTYYKIPNEKIHCGIFTTDPALIKRSKQLNIITASISIDCLNQWQQQKYSPLLV